ncbi:MAG: hypothetical protein M3N52_10155, partial [Actinomycetota bacterium]|nr:hypothetical protein [Actinomycetota bacterium]
WQPGRPRSHADVAGGRGSLVSGRAVAARRLGEPWQPGNLRSQPGLAAVVAPGNLQPAWR